MVFPIVPPWKRGRYVEPTEPESLEKLAMDAFIEELQETWVLDVSKFPTDCGYDLWKNMCTCRIIQIALKSNAVDWFSENVIVKPRSMSVNFLETSNLGSIDLKFEQRETLYWRFEKPSIRKNYEDEDLVIDIKIGDHVLKTRIDVTGAHRYNTEAIISVLPSDDFKIRFEIVQWLCEFFQRKVDKFKFGDSKMCKYWNLEEERGDIEISLCTDVAFMERVWPERQKKKLSTRISNFKIDEPINITSESIYPASNHIVYLNFTTSDFDAIVSFYKELISDLGTIRTKVSNWTSNELKKFKSELEFEDYSEELLETYRPQEFMVESEKKMVKILSDLKAAVVYVNEKEPGVYNQIGYTWWYKKVKLY